MEGFNDIFQAIEGIDENGEVKAICCLLIEKKFEDMRSKPKIQKIVYLWNANVKVSLTSDFVVVDLGFGGYTDYDYLKALELCREFTDMTDVCEFGEKPDSDLSLILSITPKGEYDFSLMGRDAAWSFVPEKTEGMCNAIRLVFVKKKFRVEFGRGQRGI